MLVWDNGAGSTLMMSPEDSVPEVRPDYVSLVQYVGDTRVVLPTRYNYATGMIEGDLTVNDGMFKLEPVEPVDIFSDPALNEKLMILKARGQLHDFANGEVTRGSFASDLVQAFNIKRLESNDTSDTSGSFGDVNVEELSDGIQIAVNNGLLLGFEDGTLRLDDPLTKEQQAVILSRVFEQLENDEMTSYQVSYSDIGQIAPWALEELGKLKPFRIYSDDTKVFEPGNQVDGEILVETMYNVYDHYTEIN